MKERVPCEFFLIRYVPDVVKGEFVNIGVLLRETASASPGAAIASRLRFTRDWSRVRCIDAQADVGLFEDLEQEFRGEFDQRMRGDGIEADAKSVLSLLRDSLSNSVQITEPRAALAENLTTEMEQLMRLYVEPIGSPRRQGRSARKATGRAAIQAAVRTEFERAGVWELMNKRVAAERYTRRGDPLHLDCGYRRRGAQGMEDVIRMFQAVSLEGDLEMAKILAYTAPQIRDGVARVEGVPLELTAVVEPLRMISDVLEDAEEEAQERYRFGVETMEQREIRVVTLYDLARVAATARYELGL